MRENLISVIIPAYNGMNTILNCIESIKSNTVEIIIVDDGSKDETLNICLELEKKHDNIKVFYQENQGQAVARACGIKNATGKYLMFLDCDDCYEANTISKVTEIIKKYDEPDLIRFRYKKIPDGYEQYKYFSEQEKLINKSDFKSAVYPMFLNSYMLNAVWTNCVKREIVNEIYSLEDMEDIKFGEDLLLNLEIFSTIKNVVFIEDVLYKYIYNTNSTTNVKDEKRVLRNLMDSIKVYTKLYEYLIKWDMYNEENVKLASKKIADEAMGILKRLK